MSGAAAVAEPATQSVGIPARACCCGECPAVKVEMLPTAARPHSTDMWLCMPHYLKAKIGPGAANITMLVRVDPW